MNVDVLFRKLMAAAQSHAPDDTVPYAFEKRILARLKPRPVVDLWTCWARVLWRAAAPCLAIMALFSIWTLIASSLNTAPEPLGNQLENTLVAGLYGQGD
jgi:hypothetical protein